MEEFSEQTLQEFYDSRNYAGAANYLRNFPAVNYQAQVQVNSLISKLERDAAIQAKMYQGATQDQKEAYAMMESLNGNGTIPRNRDIKRPDGTITKETNYYGTKYVNSINGLRANNGNKIDKITLDINDDDTLTAITEALELDDITNNTLGFDHRALGNGKHSITVSLNNTNLYKLINASNSITDRGFLKSLGEITGAGGMLGGASLLPDVMDNPINANVVPSGGGFGAALASELVGYFKRKNKIQINGVDSNGRIYSEDDFNSDNLQDAVKIVNKANKIYSERVETMNQNISTTSEVIATQFLGTGHAEAYKAMQQGIIDQTTFDRIEKRWQDYYGRLIEVADFNKKKVFAWSADSEEGAVLTRVDNKDVPDLKGEVLLAMHENRASSALCIKDGILGTMITITPKNEEGQGKTGWSKKKGEVHKQIFIENLYEESANAVFNRDTKTKAAVKNSDMKRFQYEQKLMSGSTVGYGKGLGAYQKLTDAQGNTVEVPISENDMLKILNENAIIENSVNTILGNMDNDGNLYPQTIKGVKKQFSIDEMLKTLAASGTNELVPKGSTTDVAREYYSNQLYLKMKSIIDGYIKNRNNQQ